MAFYDKDKEYLNDLYENYEKEKDFREFEKDFKDFSKGQIARMYTVKKSNDVKHFTGELNTTKEQKLEQLKSLGDYFKDTKQIINFIKIQNEDIIKKTGKDLGETEKTNPFIVTKKQVFKEFSKEENYKKEEKIIDMKLAFWENRYTKTLESVKRSNISKIVSEKNINKYEVRRQINELNDKIAIENYSFFNTYKKFLNKEITRKEFENTDSFKTMQKISEEQSKQNGLEFTPYDLYDFASIQNNISKGYLEKNVSLEKIALTKNDLDMKIYNDSKVKGRFKVANVKSNDAKFNMEVSLHIREADVNRLNLNNPNYTIMNKDSERPVLKNIILLEYTEEKVNEIKENIKKIGSFSEKTNSVLKEYARLFNEEIPKEINFDKKFIEEINRENLKEINIPKFKNNNVIINKDITKELNKNNNVVEKLKREEPKTIDIPKLRKNNIIRNEEVPSKINPNNKFIEDLQKGHHAPLNKKEIQRNYNKNRNRNLDFDRGER